MTIHSNLLSLQMSILCVNGLTQIYITSTCICVYEQNIQILKIIMIFYHITIYNESPSCSSAFDCKTIWLRTKIKELKAVDRPKCRDHQVHAESLTLDFPFFQCSTTAALDVQSIKLFSFRSCSQNKKGKDYSSSVTERVELFFLASYYQAKREWVNESILCWEGCPMGNGCSGTLYENT